MRTQWMLTPMVLSLALFSFASCGKDNPPEIYDEPLYPTDSLPDAQRSALMTTVSCENPDECHPSVGMLIAARSDDATGLSSCTASLISDSILVTNSHCIPDDLKKEGSACKGRMWVFFPKAGNLNAEQAECQEIIQASNLNDTKVRKQDYAYVRLARPIIRPSLIVQTSGFQNEQNFFLNKVDPYVNTQARAFYGILRKVTCKAVMNSFMLPEYSQEQSALALLTECLVVHGNSGSAILDHEGRARGVIQAFFNREGTVALVKKMFHLQLSSHDITNLNFGTSFACIHTPVDTSERPMPAACFDSGVRPESPVVTDPKKLEKEIHEAFAQATVIGDDVFGWKLQEAERAWFAGGGLVAPTQQYYTIVPRCFKDPSTWKTIPKRNSKSVSLKNLKLPIVEVGLTADAYVRLGLKAQLSPYSVLAEFDFSPRSVNKTGAGRVARRIFDFSTFTQRVVATDELGLCGSGL